LEEIFRDKEPFLKEIISASDRGASIVMASRREETLLKAIENRLIPLSKAFKNMLFEVVAILHQWHPRSIWDSLLVYSARKLGMTFTGCG
jgi:hypothetical protein